jgi:hypothetical protein
MERDYSHIQGSDYAYVPQKPQQPNLIQGLFEAFNGFKDARAGKVAEDEAKAEKERMRLQGELKSQRDEEDRQLNRKKLQGDIDYTEAKKLELGKPKDSGKSSGGAGVEKGTYNYKDAVKSYKDYHKIINDVIESPNLDDEEKDQAIRVHEKAALSELKSIVDNGDKLNPFQQEMFDKKYKLYYDEAGNPIRYDGDFSEEENKAYYANKGKEPQVQTEQGGVGEQSPVPATTEPPKPNPFSSLPTLKNYKEKQQSKLLGPTPFEQYQGTMQNETQEPNFSNGPTQGPLRGNTNVAGFEANEMPKSKLEVAAEDAKEVGREFVSDAKDVLKGAAGRVGDSVSEAVKYGGETVDNFVEGVKGSPAGLLLQSIPILAKAGYNYLNYGNKNASRWVKGEGDAEEGIKKAIADPKLNRKALLKMNDNIDVFLDAMTDEGKEAFSDALKEAGIKENNPTKKRDSLNDLFGTKTNKSEEIAKVPQRNLNPSDNQKGRTLNVEVLDRR